MKTKIALNMKEMQTLQKMGVDTSDASMCWIMEPLTEKYGLGIHDEFCYELSCLNPIPAYTLQDIILKLKGQVSCLSPSTLRDFPSAKKTPWLFEIHYNVNDSIKSVHTLGETPLEAAFLTLCKVQKTAPKCIYMLQSPINLEN